MPTAILPPTWCLALCLTERPGCPPGTPRMPHSVGREASAWGAPARGRGCGTWGSQGGLKEAGGSRSAHLGHFLRKMTLRHVPSLNCVKSAFKFSGQNTSHQGAVTRDRRLVTAPVFITPQGEPAARAGELTWVGAVRHEQHAQRAEADVALTPLGQEGPVHVAGLHQRGPGCGEEHT